MHVVVVGGGPAGATAAEHLARCGVETTLVEKDSRRAKTCGGALTSPVLAEFGLPPSLIERTVGIARLFTPSGRSVEVSLKESPIHLLRRERLDSHLRERAERAGARLLLGACREIRWNGPGRSIVVTVWKGESASELLADIVIGADGAHSVVAKSLGLAGRPGICAYQERVEMVASQVEDHVGIYFRSDVSPDLYGWVFPKGDHFCVGTASWVGRRRLTELLRRLKEIAGLRGARVLRREAGVLPRSARAQLVSGHVLLAGDAAGLVSPFSGEGIYFAMKSGRFAAEAILHAFAQNEIPGGLVGYQTTCRNMFRRLTRGLTSAQRMFCSDDRTREGFVALCRRPSIRKVIVRYLAKDAAPWRPWGGVKTIAQSVLSLLCS